MQTRAGAIAQADGGTLFVQNIQDMSPICKPRSCGSSNAPAFTPVGDTRQIKVDVRLICTASRDPTEDMRAGRLREDLYYRLFVIPIAMPPLRARGTDIHLLAQHYLAQIAAEEGKAFHPLRPRCAGPVPATAMAGQCARIDKCLRHAVVLHDGDDRHADMLPPGLAAGAQHAAPEPGRRSGESPDPLAGMTMAPDRTARDHGAIARHRGSVPRAARELDIAPSTIYRKREQWDKADRAAGCAAF